MTIQLTCGPTYGCGQTFAGEADGRDLTCPRCGKWWGRLSFATVAGPVVFASAAPRPASDAGARPTIIYHADGRVQEVSPEFTARIAELLRPELDADVQAMLVAPGDGIDAYRAAVLAALATPPAGGEPTSRC